MADLRDQARMTYGKSAIVSTALSCTNSKSFDIEECCDLEI